MMERPQRKRNTTRDSREIMRSSLSESTEGLRPQSKRIPRGLEWSTPKGSDFASLEQELDALPVDGFGNDEMFGDMLDDGSADDDLVAHPMFCGTGSRGGGGGGSLSGSGGGRAASGASDSGKASRKGAVVDSAADWDEEEDAVLREAVLRHGLHNWQGVSKHMLPSQLHRSAAACEARWLLVKDKVVKGPWLAEEDALLRELVKEVGAKKWSVIAESIPGRAGKQCRERWLNHLDSAVKKSDWSLEEDTVLLHAQKQVGNRWSEISRLLPGRAENAVKNRFNSLITKRIAKRTASLAARAEMEEQRDQEAEKQAMALTAKLEGKNVLQQLFTIVEPTAAETAGPYASKLASDGTPRAAYGQHAAAAAAAFTFGGQPASSSSSSSNPHAMTDGRHSDSSAGGGGVPPLGSGVGRGGLALRLQPPPTEAGDDDDGTQVDLDLMASDGALGAEQLQQAKNFFDHEKERANMFHQVAISSAEFSGMEQLLRARLNAPPSAADQEGGEQWKEPVLVPRVAPLSADPSSRGNNSSASRSNDKSAGAHGGSSSGKNTGSHRGISASGQQKWAGPRHRRHAEPDSPSSSPTANAAAAGALAPPLRRHRGGGRPGTRGFDSVAAEAESQGGGGLGQNNNNSLGGISVGGNSLSFGSCNNYSNSSSNSRGHAGPQRSRRNGNGSSFDAGGGGGGMRMGVGGAVHDEFDPLLSFAVSPSSDLTGVDVWGGAHNPPYGHSSSTSLHGGGTAAAAASAAADAASVGDSLLGGSLGMGDDLSDSFLGGSFGNGSLGLSFGSNNGSSSSGMPRAGTAAATMAAGFEPSSADHDQSLTAANIGSKLSGMSLDDEHWQQVSASVAAQHQQHHLQAPAGVGASPRGFFDGNAGSLGDGGSLGGGSSSSSSGPGFFGLHPSTSFSFSPRTQPPLEPSRIRGASAAAQHAAATQAAQAALRGAFHNTSDFAAGGGGGSSRNSGRSLKLAPPEMAAPEFSLSPTLGGFSNDRSSVREWPSTTGSGAAIRGGGGGGGYSSGPFRSNSQQSGYGWPVATSPSMSLEDEDWDLLAMGTTPHFTPHGGSSSSNTTAVWPEATTYNAGGASSASSSSSSSRGGDGKSSRFPASRHATAMPSTAGAAGAGASQTAPTPPSTKRPSRAIKLEPAESSSNPSMSPPSSVTPRARALMQLNADFRAGRVTPEDKQRLKQAILEDLAY